MACIEPQRVADRLFRSIVSAVIQLDASELDETVDVVRILHDCNSQLIDRRIDVALFEQKPSQFASRFGIFGIRLSRLVQQDPRPLEFTRFLGALRLYEEVLALQTGIARRLPQPRATEQTR